MIYIMTYEPYKDTYSWFTRKNLICAEARKKRVKVTDINDLSEIPQDDPCPVLILRSSSLGWLTELTQQASARGIHAIAFAKLPPNHKLPCSVIADDLEQGTKLAIDYLSSLGKKSLALFGLNSKLCGDSNLVQLFREYTGSSQGMYYVDDSFATAQKEFVRDISKYDSVLVAHSGTAVALTLSLRDYLATHPEFHIVSFGSLYLSQFTRPALTTVTSNTDAIPRILFSLYDFIKENNGIAYVYVRTKVNLNIGESTQYKPLPPPQDEVPQKLSKCYFYDQNISDVIGIENMLLQCDQLDLDIIPGLIEGKTYAALAEENFLSVTAVKYRVKQLKKNSGMKSISALRDILRHFFSA